MPPRDVTNLLLFLSTFPLSPPLITGWLTPAKVDGLELVESRGGMDVKEK